MKPHLQPREGRAGDTFPEFLHHVASTRHCRCLGDVCLYRNNRVAKVVLYSLEPNPPQTFDGGLQYGTAGGLWVSDSFAARSRGRLLHRPRPGVGARDCSHLLPLSTFLISEDSSIYVCVDITGTWVSMLARVLISHL